MVPWGGDWPSRVWLGTSAEDQRWANTRIPVLLGIPAKVRFISAEPLLGPVDLVNGGVWAIPDPPDDQDDCPTCQRHGAANCQRTQPNAGCSHLDWVIVGGESGSRPRPMELSWASSIVSQCRASEVSVFVKQLGAVRGRELGAGPKGGDMASWPAGLGVREFPRDAGLVQARASAS